MPVVWRTRESITLVDFLSSMASTHGVLLLLMIMLTGQTLPFRRPRQVWFDNNNDNNDDDNNDNNDNDNDNGDDNNNDNNNNNNTNNNSNDNNNNTGTRLPRTNITAHTMLFTM